MANYMNFREDYSDFSCRLKNNLNGQVIVFPVMPQNISESVGASYTQQEIIGASVPRIIYSNTSAKTLSLSLTNLTEDYLPDGFSNLRAYTRALEALVYPAYSGGAVTSPDMTLYLGNRTIRCVCTNVTISWGNLVRNQGITSCNVDLNFLKTRDEVPGYTSIINGADGD